MAAIRNIFACLVHESPECVVDLVRNLRALDPDSTILLYNGSTDQRLLADSFPFERSGAILHPRPRPLAWGRLHDFALDCMQFALDHIPFDTLTIVDSDQLAIRSGYSRYLGDFLAGQSGVGLLSSSPAPQPPGTTVGPAVAAFNEIDRWRPLLQRLPDGEAKFVHWSFWPATVFTAEAARDLTHLVATDAQVQELMRLTTIWATEEVILPTLVALLGYRIVANPCSYDYTRYKVAFTLHHLNAALARPDVFWIHPVPRRYDDVLRKHLRAHFNHYAQEAGSRSPLPAAEPNNAAELLLTLPILARMKAIEGWLEEEEADLLIAVTARALASLPAPQAVVEIGSYCGRSSVVLGSVVQTMRPEVRVYAIDRYDGRVGALDQGIQVGPPTLETFKRNLADAGLADIVEIIQHDACDLPWEQPISLLVIDGLHDYVNVARDFWHLEPSVVVGGYIAFHDYADYYPGVKTFVNEILASMQYQQVHCVRTMMVVQKLCAAQPADDGRSQQHAAIAPMQFGSGSSQITIPVHAPHPDVSVQPPLVSCIMPTADRRAFVPQALVYFLRQDYLYRELIVVDDGADAVADLIPSDPRIRYMRLEGKHTIGAKRNLACQAASGEIIVHWDDDDWMANRRLGYQVASLLQRGADVCGLTTLIHYDPASDRAWQYVYAQGSRPWAAGNTLCYTRGFWSANPFPEINVGEDTRFLWSSRPKHIVALEDTTFYVAVIHPGNASPKQISQTYWHSYPVAAVRDLLGEDWSFYSGLFREKQS